MSSLTLPHHSSTSKLTRLDRKSGDVDNDLWSCLKDDQQDSDRASHPVELESFVERLRVGHLSSRVGERVNIEDTLKHRVVLVGR